MTLEPSVNRSPTARAVRHDVFISYNHAHNDLARSLKSALEGLAKRWYRRRARDVFLDSANLSTGSSLEESVRSALISSRAYLLIASRSARESRWVNQELDLWLAEHGTKNLFIVLADGELVWDRSTRSFDPAASTALPLAASTRFTDEPLWEDLRGVDPKAEPDRVLAVAAGVVSALSGLPKDDLFGEDIRQQRIVKRIAVVIAAVMSLLVVSLIAVSVEAMHQRDVARNNGAIASAHALSASSKTLLQTRLDTALGSAVKSHMMVDDFYTRAALFQALSYDAHLVRFIRTRGFVHSIEWDATSRRLFIWGRSFVSIANPKTGTVSDLPPMRAVSAVTGSPGQGKAVAIGTSSGLLRLVEVDSGDTLWESTVSSSSVTSIAFDPVGHVVAALARTGRVVLLSQATGEVLEQRDLNDLGLLGQPTWVTFQAPGQRVLVATDRGESVLLAPDTLAMVRGPTGPVVPVAFADGASLSATEDGSTISYTGKGSITVRALAGHPHLPRFPANLPRSPGAYTIARDGAVAAVESNGVVTIVSDQESAGRSPPIRLPGAGTGGAHLRFAPDERLLASGYGRVVGIWDLGFGGLAEGFQADATPQPRNETPQVMLSDPSSGSVTVLSHDDSGTPGTRLICLRGGTTPASSVVPLGFTGRALAWNSTRTAALVASARPTAWSTLCRSETDARRPRSLAVCHSLNWQVSRSIASLPSPTAQH